MGANIAGIYGAQIFRADDKPFYKRGFTIAIAVLAVGLILAIVRAADDFLRRRKNKGQLESGATSNEDIREEEKRKASIVIENPAQSVLIGGGLNSVQPGR